MKPKRIQRKRTKGYRLPAGAVCVTRPGPFGNPYVSANRESTLYAVNQFRMLLDGEFGDDDYKRLQILELLPTLRGKDLACWCHLCPEHAEGKPFGVHCPNCAPCHSDPLGELANK